LIDDQEKELVRRRRELEDVLPVLQGLMKGAEDRPSVRYFEGTAGLRSIRQEMLRYSTAKDVWYNFSPMDHLLSIFGENDYLYFRYRKAKGIKSFTIFTTRSEKIKKELITKAAQHFAQVKFIAPELYKSSSAMTIFRDRIAIGSFAGKIGGFIIDSDSVASMAREFFMLLWNKLESSAS
jgi:hypothetical protein